MKSLYNMIARLNILLNKAKKYINTLNKKKFKNILKSIKNLSQYTHECRELLIHIDSKIATITKSINLNEFTEYFTSKNILDGVFLCITFIAIVLNIEYYVNPIVLFIQSITLVLLSLAVINFFPKKNFILKHAIVCILSAVLFYPIISLSYDQEISSRIFKLMLLFSLLIELILRIDFRGRQKQSVILYVGRYANINSFKKIEEKYDPSIVVHAGSDLLTNGLHLKNAHYAIFLEKFFRASKLFPTATKIIYAGNNDKHDFIDMLKMAKNLHLNILKATGKNCEKISKICLEDFFNYPEVEIQKATMKLSQKKICIQYNGNSILKKFILSIAKNHLCNISVLCQTEYLATNIYQDLNAVRLPDGIYETTEQYVFDPKETACIFMNFIASISNNEKYKKGRVYSINPTYHVDIVDIIALKEILHLVHTQSNVSETGESFNPINEKSQKYTCEGVTYIDFKKKGNFDLSELNMIRSSKSIRDLLDIFLSSLYEKV